MDDSLPHMHNLLHLCFFFLKTLIFQHVSEIWKMLLGACYLSICQYEEKPSCMCELARWNLWRVYPFLLRHLLNAFIGAHLPNAWTLVPILSFKLLPLKLCIWILFLPINDWMDFLWTAAFILNDISGPFLLLKWLFFISLCVSVLLIFLQQIALRHGLQGIFHGMTVTLLKTYHLMNGSGSLLPHFTLGRKITQSCV